MAATGVSDSAAALTAPLLGLSEHSAGEETPPELRSSHHRSTDSSTPLAHRPPTPLPKFQFFILCIIMLAEPVAYTQIFPYINDMCYKLGWAKSEKDVGYISGLIDSC
jgi:hypothetical protein